MFAATRAYCGHLAAPLGSPQVQHVWRLIGAAMLLAVVRVHPPGTPLAGIPWPYHAITAAAALLLLFGPRLVSLMAAAAAWIWLQLYILSGADPHYDFVADEHLLFALLPTLAALSALASAWDQRRSLTTPDPDAVARAQLWHLRLCTLVPLGFAALHKLNTDFLALRSSCATRLGERLATTWDLPASPLAPLGALGPLAVLLAEALAPALLLLYPRLGVLWLTLLAAGLGHVGPYAFNTLLVALALAFLPPAALAAWPQRAARTWPAPALVALALIAGSAARFTSDSRWWPYAIFEAILVLVAWLAVIAGRSPTRWWRPALPTGPWLPGGFVQRSLAVYAVGFLLIAGLSPYLGLKYRLSFAMLSNLRVDDDRWNSLVIPRAIHLPATDPFVHVHAVRLAGQPYRPAHTDADALRPRTYGPQEFRRRHELALRRWLPLSLELRYRGVDYSVADLRFDPRLRALLARLPREPLFQAQLSGPGPQACVH